MGLVGRAAFSWLLLLLQSRLVLLLQDGLLCNAAMQLLFRLTTAAKRFAVQTPVVQSPRNACWRDELQSLRRAICNAKLCDDKAPHL